MEALKVSQTGSGKAAVFNSKASLTAFPATHDVVYVPHGWMALYSAGKICANLAEGAAMVDTQGQRVADDFMPTTMGFFADSVMNTHFISYEGRKYELCFTFQPITAEMTAETAKSGGIVDGDITINGELLVEKPLICAGKLTVSKGAVLRIAPAASVTAQDLDCSGTIEITGSNTHYVSGEISDPCAPALLVTGTALLKEQGMLKSTGGLWAHRLKVEGSGEAQSFCYFDVTEIEKDAVFTHRNGIAMLGSISVGDRAVLRLLNDEGMNIAFSDFSGGGMSNCPIEMGQQVTLEGDDEALTWLVAFGEQSASVRIKGNIRLEVMGRLYCDKHDMDNLEMISEQGDGNAQSPLTLVYREKEIGYPYNTTKKRAVHMFLRNRFVQRGFEGAVWEYGNRYIGFNNSGVGQVWAHRLRNDAVKMAPYADLVAIAQEQIEQ